MPVGIYGMPLMAKLGPFFQRQVAQIQEEGMSAFYRKIKKGGYLLLMNIFAPLAVQLGINWPKAYNFVGENKIRELKKLRSRPNRNGSVIKEAEDHTLEYFRTIVDRGQVLNHEQDWINASRALADLYFLQGNMKELNAVCQKEAEMRRSLAKAHQFDSLGIEFVPRYLAVGSIGVYELADAYIKAGMLGLRPFRKLILLVDPKVPVNNPCYLNYWRRYITVVSDPLLIQKLTPLEKWLEISFKSYIFFNEKMHKIFLALGAIREQWVNENRLPILTLSDEDYERGWKCLKSFGMQQDDWFVCLHVRERGWRGDNSSAEDFRNADIDTYLPAIKAITDAGGWVVRMGDSGMKPLPKMPQVIDYAHSDAKSDWMDVFLCAQCRFFVATASGLYTFAIAFGTPVVMTNLLPACAMYYLSSRDLFIPRLGKFAYGNRYLNFMELLSPPVGVAAVQSNYDKKNIKVIQNTAEEIRGLVQEMLERCNGRLQYSQEDEQLQKLFRSVTLDSGKLYGEENPVVNARIGRDFLRKHAGLISSKEQSVSVANIE